MTDTATRQLTYRVREENSGLDLGALLTARFTYHTLGEWTALAAAGRLLVNGSAAEAGRKLAVGDSVTFLQPDRPEPPADTAVEVLYEDSEIIVVSKPGDLPAHPAGKYFRNTLWWLLREKFGVASPGIINRLDRETSGVTLVAKNPRADRLCREQFAARAVVKKYTAVTEGVLRAPVRCRGRMGAAAGSAIQKKRAFYPDGLPAPEGSDPADTEFFPLGAAGALGLVQAVPHTGRLHQIRATLLQLGLPIAGDKLYGLDESFFLRFVENKLTAPDRLKLRLPRQALNAGELTFRHPATGLTMTVTAPLPADMLSLLG
jgi:23S rRNA pseudouridine955/2504/2580 synthase/23S rRNA pseudouridine1911/1915/1917 synthase